jgi:hypothetical protein
VPPAVVQFARCKRLSEQRRSKRASGNTLVYDQNNKFCVIEQSKKFIYFHKGDIYSEKKSFPITSMLVFAVSLIHSSSI